MGPQQELLPLPTGGERPDNPSGAPRRPKVKAIERRQSLLVPLDVEALVGPDHKVRAIWELTGKRKLSRFEERMVSVEGKAGRPSWDPRLLVSVWVYSYSEEKLGLRKFRLRGWSKASTEALWATITYNVMPWIRLAWRPAQAAAQPA